MPAGRPTKYRPEYDEQVYDWMVNKGQSILQVAARLGVLRETVRRWGREYPSFGEVLKQGKEGREAWWESLGQQMASGQIKGAPALVIFTQKAQFGWREQDNTEAADPATLAGHIVAAWKAIDALEKMERDEVPDSESDSNDHPGLNVTNQDALSPLARKNFEPGSD